MSLSISHTPEEEGELERVEFFRAESGLTQDAAERAGGDVAVLRDGGGSCAFGCVLANLMWLPV